jgi:formylglycine-generating enzyme required for sulfatase activity
MRQRRIVQLIGQFVYPCVPQERVPLGEGVEMKFSFIPPGQFLMGDNGVPFAAEVPEHKVKLTKGFYLGSHQVTQAQWMAVMETDPSLYKGDERPVENVSWDDCQEFCQQLTKRLLRKGVCRLPTEAEWEYACRAGTTTRVYTGDDETVLKTAAWFAGNSGGEHHPVGELAANAWGLYDMHGNVNEWCGDWLLEGYSSEQQIDPVGPAEGSLRVNRGGNAYSRAVHCLSAMRYGNDPGFQHQYLGFRVCLQLG